MKHNRELLEAIHTRTYEGIDVLKEVKGNSYAMIEFLVEIDTLMGLMEKHYHLPLFHKDQDANAYAYVYDELATFYVNHQNILNDYPNFTFVGKTNKNNLVFENTDKQIKITPSGNII
jgi:hypothetical protein